MSAGAAPHILFVDDYPREHIGGGEQHILYLARACREWGWRVGIACTAGAGFERVAREGGFEVWPVAMGRHHPFARRRLERVFAEARPDIVHNHGFLAMTSSVAAARRAGVPRVLATIHNMPSAPLVLRPGIVGAVEYRLRSAVYRRTAPMVDAFICVVTAARDELAALGVDAARLIVIPNGIPDPALAVAGGLHAPHAENGSVLVGSVGRLENLKAYHYFVEAAAMAAEKNPDVRFKLVGDGSLRDALQQQAAAASLGDRFEMPGWAHDALAEMVAMDVYLVSSVTDTTNLTVLEAMGLGKPVIATAVGGIPDAVADGENGFLVPPRQPALMAEKILALASDADMRARMGAEGRRRFEESFVLERMLEAHRAFYESLLAT